MLGASRSKIGSQPASKFASNIQIRIQNNPPRYAARNRRRAIEQGTLPGLQIRAADLQIRAADLQIRAANQARAADQGLLRIAVETVETPAHAAQSEAH